MSEQPKGENIFIPALQLVRRTYLTAWGNWKVSYYHWFF
jgi:hypothetical protein